jgi:phage terminase large subunit-like protein
MIDAPNIADLVAELNAGDELLSFMRLTWQRPDSPLLVGRHTQAICERIDRAMADFARGVSTYLEIVVPFRHGKSDLSSRYLPAQFLGRFPDEEVIQTSYGADLSEGFSSDVERIMGSPEFARVFPGISLDPRHNNATERRILGHTGRLTAIGRTGGASGKGAALLVVDDLLKNRQEAESETTRASAWDGLTNDLLTRLAPVHIVLVVNTRWHVDDVCGRIHERMDPASEKYDPEFFPFERLHFAAEAPDGAFLFPERFSEQWYRQQRASLGSYGYASLMQGDPTVRGGNMLSVDGIQWVHELPPETPRLNWVRVWDLASSEKERAKDDPDYTAGTLVAVHEDHDNDAETLYFDDVVLTRQEAGARNELIKDTARRDRKRGIPQYIEAVAGYKDAFTTLRDALAGIAVVHRIKLAGDKIARAGFIEPLFEACRVIAKAGPYKQEVVKQVGDFPGGIHDDIVDNLSSGYRCAKLRNRQLKGAGSVGMGAR